MKDPRNIESTFEQIALHHRLFPNAVHLGFGVTLKTLAV